MPTDKIKRSTYLDDELNRKLQNWMAENKIFSHSKAIAAILKTYLK